MFDKILNTHFPLLKLSFIIRQAAITSVVGRAARKTLLISEFRYDNEVRFLTVGVLDK